MKFKKIIIPAMSMLAVAGLASCGEAATPEVSVNPEIKVQNPDPSVSVNPNINVTPEVTVINPTSEEHELKYVFMFIGDGMSYPQIQEELFSELLKNTKINYYN